MNFKRIVLIAIVLQVFWNCASIIVPAWEAPHKSRPVDRVRVSLGKAASDLTIRSEGMIRVYDINELIIKKAIDSLTFNPASLKNKIKIVFEKNQFTIKGNKYRGALEVIPEAFEGAILVNVLPVEDYLLAVVPSEMPPSWPQEALKAQAVCARTYVVNEILASSGKPYDVESTTTSQVYGGMDKENPRTDKAVRDTQGILAVYEGKPIQSFFHSNSGGVTEKSENVWGGKLEYLTSIKSEYCREGTNYSWKLTVPYKDMNKKLTKLGIGEIQDIQVMGRTPSGRVDLVEIEGSQKTIKMKGNEFRKVMGADLLKSLRFGIKKELAGYFIKGLGYGHGVGMSQWGSHVMAKENYSYQDILHYYFKGINLARIPEK